MEKQLFDWDSYDIIDDGVYSFTGITLKVDIGQHKAGTKFDSAAVNYQEGKLVFSNEEGDTISKHELKLVVA